MKHWITIVARTLLILIGVVLLAITFTARQTQAQFGACDPVICSHACPGQIWDVTEITCRFSTPACFILLAERLMLKVAIVKEGNVRAILSSLPVRNDAVSVVAVTMAPDKVGKGGNLHATL